MNLSNLPAQLIVIILGWIFTLQIQKRANIRSEAIRKKDKIIDRIDRTVEWAEKNIPFELGNQSRVEEIYASMISQIEIRVQNLYSLLENDKKPLDTIVELRAIDILESNAQNETIKRLRIAAIDLIEDLEHDCDSKYFIKSKSDKLKEYIHEAHGFIFGVVSLIVLFVLFILIKYFFS